MFKSVYKFFSVKNDTFCEPLRVSIVWTSFSFFIKILKVLTFSIKNLCYDHHGYYHLVYVAA